jgi:4-hydroxymandelate oxidase
MTRKISRRNALAGVGSLVAASPLMADQPPKLVGEPAGRIAPRADLVNVPEFEDVAGRRLAPDVYARIAGSDRAFFDRITFRPRMMVPTTNLDESIELFGEKIFAPILVGPTARQQMYHPDGELATVRGASAAKALMVVSSDSSVPFDKIAAEAKTTLWYQVYAEGDLDAVRGRVQAAVKAGCKAVCITVGAQFRNVTDTPNPAKLASMPKTALNWNLIDQIRQGVNVPVVVKGIMTPEDADAAVKHGIQGVVVSNYGGPLTSSGGLLTKGMASSIEMLPSIVDAVGKRAPVLIDGSFRRGSDIFKALAYGARAVMIGRPVLWGLAAYGADGVQSVLEMLQTEVGRDMGHCGKPTIASIDRTVVKLHEV